MEGIYDILLGGHSVGQAQVCREGLYYSFTCNCRFTGEVMYKIAVSCGDQSEILGTPVPQGQGFVLRRKLPVKYFGNGEVRFRAVPTGAKLDETFVPIRPEEPFSYLNRLKNAYLEKRNGQIGIVLKE